MDVLHVFGVGVVFLMAGGVKGVTGMGLPTVAASLLGLWMSPWDAAALLVVPALITNVAQCRGPHWRGLVARLWPAWLGLAAVTLLAPGWAPHASRTAWDARALLGWILIAYGAWGLCKPALPDLAKRSIGWGLLAGAATGWVSSTTAVFVMPLLPYLQSLRLGKDEMVQALGLSFTVATLALAARLQATASLQPCSPLTLVALGAAFVGLGVGACWRARLSGPAFQKALCLVFIGLGLANLIR